MFKKILILIAMAYSLPAISGPVLNVGSLNEYMQSGKNTLAKRIYNTGDSTAYVRISIHEIVFNAQGKADEKILMHQQ